MRKVTIVGAGQAGLMVGVGLVRRGYDVTIISNRTPEEIRTGRVTSSQAMQSTSIFYEEELGLRFWKDIHSSWDGGEMNIINPGTRAIDLTFSKRFGPANGLSGVIVESIDQRVKMPTWMYRFEELGGKIVYEEANLAALERYESESDLVLVASGKGEIGKIFERDDEKSFFDKPTRGLGIAYVRGMKPRRTRDNGELQRGLHWNGLAGVGEYFSGPALTTSGECHIMVFEAVPGGPTDILDTRDGPDAYLKNCLSILEQYFPHEAERCQNVELTDELGILSGRFPPTTRKPVGTLPNGRHVLGIADSVCLNDPITGQGSCNAAKSARLVTEEILNRGHDDFDGDWMQSTFDKFWSVAKPIVDMTNAFLVEPTVAMKQLLSAANESQAVADVIFSGLDNGVRVSRYMKDEALVDKLLSKIAT